MASETDKAGLARFAGLGFDDFRRRASDPAMSKYEKIGFPDSYRKDQEALIWRDILVKLPALASRNRVVLDIGPGCSDLPHMLIEHCRQQDHQLLLLDSAEMLAHLEDASFIRKFPARFPDAPALLDEFAGKIDVLLCYSVLLVVFAEGNMWHFLDQALRLLAPGGSMLLGDIPNISKRKRFFASEAGQRFHSAFVGREEIPEVHFNRLEPGQIDDAIMMAIMSRCRSAGFDAFIVPQDPALPMANRREDILVMRP